LRLSRDGCGQKRKSRSCGKDSVSHFFTPLVGATQRSSSAKVPAEIEFGALSLNESKADASPVDRNFVVTRTFQF
jgi:hypothetical protein